MAFPEEVNGFRIQGNVQTTVFDLDGEPDYHIRCSFLLEVSNAWWGLSLSDYTMTTQGREESMADEYLSGDGTYTYVATSHQRDERSPTTRYVGILSDAIPTFPIQKLLWIVYVSGIYEGPRANLSSVPPPWMLLPWEDEEFFKSDAVRSSQPPFSFQSLSWDHPGYSLEGGKRRPFPPPLDQGYRVGELRAGSYLELAGLRIPADVKVLQFIPHVDLDGVADVGPDGAVKYRVVQMFEAVVSELSPAESIPSRPRILPGTVVQDGRFSKPELGFSFLEYTQKAAVWPEVDDPNVQAQLQAELQRRQPLRHGTSFPFRRWVAVSILLLAVSGPLIFLWLSRARSHSR
jgi:hypothetical protein